MEKDKLLAERFEANRAHLRQVAYRMLGSLNEADDAVQEAWIRLSRSDATAVDNLGGWLTTVVARVCLDMLRSRKSRREETLDAVDAAPPAVDAHAQRAIDPEAEALLADSVGIALLIVLEKLTPAERVAFVLHDMFDLPFEDIATIVGRSPTAARQLASRARRRVHGAAATEAPPRNRAREIVGAFLAASREGNFAALIAMLDPGVVLHADQAAVLQAASRAAYRAPKLEPETHGAENVASVFSGRARAAQPALIDGVPGLAWAPGGVPRIVFTFTVSGDKIAAMGIIADPERIGQMQIELVGE